jgi:L-ascorbate metabolism protein UlaG (beta-lactamase superfamily)
MGLTRVTYIANEGFLVQTDKIKILIDAIFGDIKSNWCEQPGDSLLNLIVNGIPPFDHIDFVLVSHYHSDHFNEKMIAEYMVKNPKTILVCSQQVNQMLKKNSFFTQFEQRIKEVASTDQNSTSISTEDAQIMTIEMEHGSYFEKDVTTGEVIDLHRDVENIAYMVKTQDCTFFHTGDALIKSFQNLKESGFVLDRIDLAFMDRVFMQADGMNVISGYIKPEKLIFMHIEPARLEYYKNIVKDFPDIFIFSKPLETVNF